MQQILLSSGNKLLTILMMNFFIRTDMDEVNSATRIGEKTVRTTFLALLLGDLKRLLFIMNASFCNSLGNFNGKNTGILIIAFL